MSCKKDIDNVYQIKLSRPLSPFYNVIGVNEGDDVTVSIPINNDDWLVDPLNVTIYRLEDRTMYVSVSIDNNPETATIDDFSFGTGKALVVVEDRTDPMDIETIETIGYIYFKQFDSGTTAVTQEGFISVEDTDGSQITAPYYSTGLEVN